MGHGLQGSGQADLLQGHAPGHLESSGQPRRGGQVAIPSERLPSFDLGQTAKALR
jgi:hypothetical protein